MVLLSLNERLLADLQLLSELKGTAQIDAFCGVALDFLATGTSRSRLRAAASSLGAEPEAVAGAVQALTHLFLEAARANASPSDLAASLADSTLSEEAKRGLADCYAGAARGLRDRLALGLGAAALAAAAGEGAGAGGVPPSSSYYSSSSALYAPATLGGGALPSYVGLDWRLEVGGASRFALAGSAPRPSFTMRLDTVGGSSSGGGDGGAGGGGGGGGGGDGGDAGGPRSLLFSADYAALSSALAAVDEALEESRSAHARRVVRYVR